MITIQYFENNSLFLSQLVNHIPSVDEKIRIKGRNAKVIRVEPINENLNHVHIELEKIEKKPLLAKDPKKRRR